MNWIITTVIALQAGNPSQFDLVCSGAQEMTSILGREQSSYTAQYRIDLDQGKFCEGECRAHHDIAAVGPTQITLFDRSGPGRDRHSNFVNRETGAHRSVLISGAGASAIISNRSGTCERSEFSGFPEFTTRF